MLDQRDIEVDSPAVGAARAENCFLAGRDFDARSVGIYFAEADTYQRNLDSADGIDQAPAQADGALRVFLDYGTGVPGRVRRCGLCMHRKPITYASLPLRTFGSRLDGKLRRSGKRTPTRGSSRGCCNLCGLRDLDRSHPLCNVRTPCASRWSRLR